MRTWIEDVESYLMTALEGFKSDPADSLYQEGYEAALEDVLDYVRDNVPNTE